MSDLLIKNMKMPIACASCDLCVLSSDKQNFFCKRQIGKRFHWSLAVIRQGGCHLVELPDKHGNIVDGDKVLECLASILEKHDYIMVRDNLIKSVPILLEASE